MTTRTRALGALLLATIALTTAACSPADPGPSAPTSGKDRATDGDATSAAEPADDTTAPAERAETQPDDTTYSLPAVDCAGLAPLLDPLLEGLVLDEEDTVADSEFLDCSWIPAEERLDDIRLVSVQLSVGDPEVPDIEAAAEYGLDYSTDPRLDPHGGVLLWISTGDDTVMGGGSGTVYVPGLDIMVSSAGFGKETGFDQDHLVRFAVGVLALPGA